MYVRKMEFKFDSSSLSKEINIGIVMPDEIMKIVVLLHGYGGSYQVLDTTLPLVEYARKYKCMLVMPDVEDGYYIDQEGCAVSKFIAEELPEFVRESFGISNDIGVILAGISMGGYGAVLIGSKYSRNFDAVISISGAFIAEDVVIGNPMVVGNPANNVSFKYPPLILTCGSEDILIERNLKLKKVLDEREFEYEWFIVEGGEHKRDCFDAGLRHAFDCCFV